MFILEKLGVLQSRYLELKDDMPLCESCMFGTSRRRQRRTKGKKSGSTNKETDNKTGAAVPVDQIQSSHPGLISQLSGKLTSAQIWSAQVMVDYFIDLTYVNLTRITSQEETLALK